MTGGPISGGTIITLGGFGFNNFDSESTARAKARCRWGADGPPVEPIAIAGEVIICRTSPRATPGDVTLRVSTNGQQFVDTQASLHTPSANGHADPANAPS